jgi:hypothetical protein
MKNVKRRLELSTMFLEMGQSLIDEGKKSKDLGVSQVGTMFIFLAGIVYDDDDIFKFSELISMFSAKKLMESFNNETDEISEYMKKQSSGESYDSIIEKLKEMTKDKTNTPKRRRKKGDEE